MLFCRATLPLSLATLTYPTGPIRRHRAAIGSRRRRLSPSDQALLVLVRRHKGESFAEATAGFGVSTSTC